MDGKTPICYYKCDAEDYVDPDMKIKWVPFEIDRAFNEVKESHMSGIF